MGEGARVDLWDDEDEEEEEEEAFELFLAPRSWSVGSVLDVSAFKDTGSPIKVGFSFATSLRLFPAGIFSFQSSRENVEIWVTGNGLATY